MTKLRPLLLSVAFAGASLLAAWGMAAPAAADDHDLYVAIVMCDEGMGFPTPCSGAICEESNGEAGLNSCYGDNGVTYYGCEETVNGGGMSMVICD